VLSVDQGTVEDFGVRIIMIAEDGRLLHIHTIQNLSNVTAVFLQLATCLLQKL
jgi:hypothetical protein